ncbi:MAG: transferase hexapeptide repeat containing protein [Verrucomicrobiaceae bacterium]|nr:transferase hexapeptide repeat containing protein [Verrucomicrobiaceae bacterium]
MSKPSLILIGAGGHAHACIDVIEQQDQFEIAGLVGTSEELDARHFSYSVIATDSDLHALSKTYRYAFISVGQIQSPDLRTRLYQGAVNAGFQLPIILAPTAYVSRHASIGAGSIVMHGAVVNAGAAIGVNCIVNTRAIIEHDTTVGDHCHISTGAILNGNVTVGAGSFIGSGSIVKEGVSIGAGCMVGMGLSVRHNQNDHTRFVGANKT